MEKNRLRKEVLELRKSIDVSSREAFNREIYDTFINSDLYNNAKNIFVYVSFNNEVDTKMLINQMFKDGKNVYVPKINSNDCTMEAIKIKSLDELKKNFYGTLEPIGNINVINPYDIDLVLIPGVVFDKSGNRIGMGKGYYDRYIKRLKSTTKKVAVAFNIQLVNEITVEEHDEKVDYIITESNFIKV